MGRLLSTFLIGGLFGLGIAVSGMIDPAKVLNFFDIAGAWDPSLAFVMGGGLAVAVIGYRLTFAYRARPALGNRFVLPSPGTIDGRLVGGAALFGVGWGIAGFCPGGAVPALGLLQPPTLIFLAAMIAGMIMARLLLSRRRPAVAGI